MIMGACPPFLLKGSEDLAFSLKHIPEWNALQIKQNGKNSSNVYNRFQKYLRDLNNVHQEDNWTWYIHDQQFDNWMNMFGGITTMTQTEKSIRGEEKPIYPDINYELKHKEEMKLPPYPFQELGASFLIEKERAIIGDEMGLGKAQPLTSKIMTPDSYKLMGDIEVGDTILHPAGGVQTVESIHPQGKKPVYKIEFDDGSATESTSDHLWNIQTFNDRYNHDNRFRTLPLGDIIDKMEGKSDTYKIFIPLTESADHSERQYVIDPYVMGYIISDGVLSKEGVVQLFIEESEARDTIKDYLPEDVHLIEYPMTKKKYLIEEPEGDEKVYEYLKECGLHGQDQFGRFIPEEYLYGSKEQRLELLRGIMDAGGYSSGTKVAEYGTVSKELSDNITQLVNSLGGRTKSFTSEFDLVDGSKQKMYRLSITMPTGVEVFKTMSKLEKQPLVRKYQYNKSFKKITYIGDKETQCIQVSNADGLYLTDDYIVTHNTMSALTAYNELFQEGKVKKSLLIVPASLKFQWRDEIDKFTGYLSTVIDGTKAQRRKQYEAFENDLTNFCLISYETMRNDIDIVEQLPFDMVVADESHKLKNRSTKLYKAFDRLDSNYLFLLTGTPMQNKLDELYALFKLIDQDILGGVTKFKKKHYIIGEKFGKRFVELGYRNLDEVRKRTSPYIIRRTKNEVAPDLPERIYSKVYVDMYKPQRELYEEIELGMKLMQDEINEYYEDQTEADAAAGKKHPKEDILLGYMYMLQAVSNHPIQLAKSDSKLAKTYTPFIAKARNSAKLDELLDILGPLMDEGSKVVVFSQYVTMLEIILDHIVTRFGFEPYFIHGGVKSEDRNRFVNEFTDHPLRNIMLLSDAGNYGLVI